MLKQLFELRNEISGAIDNRPNVEQTCKKLLRDNSTMEKSLNGKIKKKTYAYYDKIKQESLDTNVLSTPTNKKTFKLLTPTPTCIKVIEPMIPPPTPLMSIPPIKTSIMCKCSKLVLHSYRPQLAEKCRFFMMMR